MRFMIYMPPAWGKSTPLLYHLAMLQKLTEGNLAMRSRDEILEAHQGDVDSDLIEVLLDIRAQLYVLNNPEPLIAEQSAPSRDRVVICIGYTDYLLSDTMTSDDVASLLRFFDGAEQVDFHNVISAERPKIEIRLVPRDAITFEEITVNTELQIPATLLNETDTKCAHCEAQIDTSIADSFYQAVGHNEVFCNEEHYKAYHF